MMKSGILVAAAAMLLAVPRASGNEARTLETTDSGITIELATDDYALTDVVHGGEAFSRVDVRGYGRTTAPGLPSLPVKGVVVGVPFGADVSLEVLSIETESLGPRRVEPAPAERIAGDADFPVAVQEYLPDAEFYASARTYPEAVAELGFDTTLRHQRIVQVVFHPFQYSARSGALALHRRIAVKLVLRDARRPAGLVAPAAAEPEWEWVYRGTVLNYEDARRWRLRPEPRRGRLGAGLRQDHEAFRLRTGERGIHRVTYAELSAAGLTTPLSTEDVAVYQRSYDEASDDPFVTTPVPVVVVDADEDGLFDGLDHVFFFAQSFEDQFMPVGYEDRYGNDNVYWFGWGEGLAERMETRPTRPAGPPRVTPTAFRDTLRFEEDVYFDSTPASGVVDFWSWTDYTASGGDTHVLPFSIHDIDPSGDVRLRARYQGMVSEPHTIDFSILRGGGGQNAIGTFAFTGLSYSMDEDIYSSPSPIPASYFADGENSLKTVGSGGSWGRSGANLDWFEFAYDRGYRAVGGWLEFTNGGATGDTEFSVGGFTQDAVRLFDVTSPLGTVALELGPENIVPDDGGYRLVYQEAVGGFTRYEAVEDGAYLSVLEVERRDPADLSSNEGDLIVITHESFAAGVEPLLEHREEEGVAVSRAGLEEVYDEFGGGLPGPQAIRNYVMYAYEEWEPAPQFVLLVGDASEDTRDILGSSAPNFMPSHLFVPSTDDKIQASDQWFVRGTDPTGLPVMFIGRLPVGSGGELSAVVSKILAYESDGSGAEWRDDVLFVADDLWSYASLESPYSRKSYESRFTDVCQELGDVVAASPGTPDTTMFLLRRYTDPYHGETIWGDIGYAYETAQFVRTQGPTSDLLSLMNQGAIIVNFEGHGNRSQLTHEQLFLATFQQSRNDVRLLTNDGRPFIFLGFSCELARLHESTEATSIDCITEQMLVRPASAAVATFACSSVAYLGPNAILNEKVFEAFFLDPPPEGPPSEYSWPRWALGGTLAKGMIKYLIDQGYPSMPQTYMLFGDPLMHVEMHPPSFRVTVNGVPHLSGDYLEATGGVSTIVADVADEVEIDPASIEIEETDSGPVNPMDYTVVAVGDTLSEMSRRYRLTYDAEIREWSYDIRISATDANGQTGQFTLRVSENDRLLLRDVVNHPNPFVDRTSIIFLVNRTEVNDSPVRATIRIYTVGGRLVRVFKDLPTNLNYNAVEWDGTDEDGDPVANGLYLYVIEASAGGASFAPSVGRMAKVK